MEDEFYREVNGILTIYNSKCKDEINILHLSDLHFGIEKADKTVYKVDEKRQADTLRSLIKTLKDDSKVPNDWKPDVIIITGDIGWTGKKDEYIKFKETFLEPLLNQFEKLSENKVITCPGNHDLIRENAEYFQRPHSNCKLEIPPITRETIETKRKEHFQDYVDCFCNGDPQKLVTSLKFEEWPWLLFLVLNSAWDCRDDKDEGVLRVGLELLEEITNDVDENDTVVALFHHPHIEINDFDIKRQERIKRNWLHISERESTREGDNFFAKYLDDKADFILNGHIHVKTAPVHSKTGKSIQLISGTAYSNDSVKYHCRILKIRKEDEPLYIDMETTLAECDHLWNTSTPKNFRAFISIANRKKQIFQKTEEQKKNILNYKRALEEFKNNKDIGNIIRLLIQQMKELYPEIQLENKFEEQPITDEVINEIIDKINILQLTKAR